MIDSVFEAIGTPLIRIRRFMPSPSPRTFVKFEAMNPGGSSKDRSARSMLSAAERAGKLRPGGTVIISTSGNMGIALAMLCAVRGYRLMALVDPKLSLVNQRLLQIYGAELVMVRERDEHGGYHRTRLRKAGELCQRHPDALHLDQYDNEWNGRAHEQTTAPEIVEALNGQVPAVVVPAGTAGTLMGIARYFKRHSPKTHVWAVDEHGSIALPASAGPGPRYLNGMGTSQRPANYDYENFHEIVDRQYFVGAAQGSTAARDLARTEGVLPGGSGGAVMHVLREAVAREYGPAENVVGLLPDHGARYMQDLFDDWLAAHGRPALLGVEEPRTK